ncbi:MAG: FAD binding domain-containing protein [Paracoccaceae bacterium]
MLAFDLVVPTKLEEALGHLSGAEAQAIAGGQTLIPTMKARLAAPERLVSLRGIDELRGLSLEGDALVVRAMTTHAEVARGARDAFPALADLAGNIGDPMVRNRGTIGGSLANNDPSACYPSAVLACGATILTTRREILADDFFQGLFATALEENEVIRAVRFPIPRAACYVKFAQAASRFALTGVFVARFDTGVRVAVTGASSEGVFRWAEAEVALGEAFGPAAVEALEPPAGDMISDPHGSGAYRAHLARVLTARAATAMAG